MARHSEEENERKLAEKGDAEFRHQQAARETEGEEQPEYATELPPGAWKYLLALALCITALPFVVNMIEDRKELVALATDPDTAASPPAPVNATMSIMPGLGIDVDSIPSFMRGQLEKQMTTMVVENALAYRAELGYDDAYEPVVESSSSTLKIQNKAIVTFHATLDERIRILMALGRHEDNLVRITCMRASNHEISLLEGECARKLASAFDLNLDH